jgi:alpha-D-xyloside xylohydrolase
MLHAHSPVNSEMVYEGQRSAAPDQRVFIPTRSAFAGQQHDGAGVWSGDITSTWTALPAQIPAGLGLWVWGSSLLEHGHRRIRRPGALCDR